MTLLERDEYLFGLTSQFQIAAGGEGQVAVIFGDAGIGKTSLVESFTKQYEDKASVYWGACDDLFTPRPLAPLYDIAGKMKSKIIDKLEQGASRPSIFNEFLNEIHLKEPSIIVIEDVHWADESTFDFIKFLAKRINKYKSLLIITYRSDEIGSTHPLRISLSNIPTKYFRRSELLPLSINAVKVIAKSFGRDGDSIFTKTNGNPFLITELLMNDQENIPATVKDLMIFRLNRLSADARSAVETFSVIPGAVEKWLINLLIKNYCVVDEAVESGILKIEKDSISFRHELGRLAVEESLSESKRIKLNSFVLDAFLKQKNIDHFLARIIHHAARAYNREIIIKYVPLAAERAASLGSHRGSASYYELLMQNFENFKEEEKAEILEKYSYQCYLTDQLEKALEARLKLLTIWKNLNQKVKEGNNLRWLSRISWFLGNKKQADSYAEEAVKILESQSESSAELAMAYSNRSQLFMLSGDVDNAVLFGEKVIRLADSLGNLEILSHALINVGVALLENSYNEDGEKKLLNSLQIALDNGYEEHAARSYTGLGCRSVENKIYQKAKDFFNDGISYSIEHDLDSYKLYMQAWLARLYFETGEWNQAGELAQNVLNTYGLSVVSRIPAQTTLGWLRLRRGDPEALKLLREVQSLANETGELQRIGPVSVAFLEAAWLTGDTGKYFSIGKAGYDLALQSDNSWIKGQLAYYLKLCNKLPEIPANIAEPYLMQLKGDWKSAAAIWEKIGCPYEKALALSEGDLKAQFAALEILKELGANPLLEKLQKKMRKQGIKNIPKGPRQSTQKNPMGLTGRQIEILNLVANGLSNSDIGNKLYISARTVENHISTIFSKLNIHTRTEAAALVHSNRIKK
jgi:ATP/maltotriose-dependent transcriptional regulator MalT